MFLLLETWRLEGWVDSRELAHLLMLDLAYLLQEVWFGSAVESKVCWSVEYGMQQHGTAGNGITGATLPF